MKHHHPNIKLYLGVFAVLMALTVVTVLVSYLHFPKTLAILIGLAIATFKAGLVATFFMHLKGERALIFSVLGVTFFFVIFLYLLPIVDMSMVADRVIHAPTAQNTQPEHGH
ncbi:MAG: cytochrome C oxidase subunit IV family protein [Elusimicrobia bacterium]|nr:cytochrome C oxidase subunit IV family protein [Elusimicrobiota bacterium]